MAAICLLHTTAFLQPQKNTELPGRPRLVVGLMVDQMRWDFFYRFQTRYSAGGFNRILRQGFSCENAHIPYAQTVTAPGHASVYAGSPPAIHGIMGNDWYDAQRKKEVYCVEDEKVTTIGGSPNAEPMSPRNLQVTNLADQIRLATNFRSKVVGVAIKDRGAILPAGHTGDAYWYDAGTGHFVTSTHYYPSLPGWADAFNKRKLPDSLYKLNWNTLYPIETYLQSDRDNVAYEGRFMHEKAPVFPHELASQAGTNYGTISSTPHGNTLTLEFAKAAMRAEGLGRDEFTDLLAISLSSPDYAGHQFGPNSIELEDMYLRLDKELEAFFNLLDAEVGKGEWLFFITADHGVAHVPGFLAKNKIQVATNMSPVRSLNEMLQAKYGVPNIIEAYTNYHLHLNHDVLDSADIDKDDVVKLIIKQLHKDTTVWLAFEATELPETVMPAEVKERFAKGMHPKLRGDIVVVLRSGFFSGYRTGTTHGAWYPYDAHIPMAFLGWGIKPGYTNRRTWMIDIAPTVAALLKIEPPSGCIGLAVPEITDLR